MSDQLEPGPWLNIHEELGVEPPEFDDRPLGDCLWRSMRSPLPTTVPCATSSGKSATVS